MIDSLIIWLTEPGTTRQHFGFNAVQWEAFMTDLKAPAREIPALERLMREPSIFERGLHEGRP